MNIKQRVLVTLAISLIALVGIGTFGLVLLGQSQARLEQTQTKLLPSIKALDDAKGAQLNMRIALYQSALYMEKDPKQAIPAADETMDKALSTYERNYLSDETDKKMLQDDQTALAEYRASRDELFRAIRGNDLAEARRILADGNMHVTSSKLRDALLAHIDYNYSLASRLEKEGEREYAAEHRNLLIVMAIIVLAVIALGYSLLRRISSSLFAIQDTMHKATTSLDFTIEAPVLYTDEIGETATAFNKLLSGLRENFKTLHGGALQVSLASEQMATTAKQVSTASAEQSEASAAIAAAVEEMTVSINHVAARAVEAHSLSTESGTLAQTGSTVISQTVTDIREISDVVGNASSTIALLEQENEKVTTIVQVIKDIADQTNLLALNAAIEAARAGEQGRGFAVVADEVRKLAERTTGSTQEISTTIESMRDQSQLAVHHMNSVESLVTNSVTRADTADKSIRQIGDSAIESVLAVTEISDAIREQSDASSSIAVQIERIAQMCEESHTSANLVADSATQLQSQAKQQLAILGQYKF